MSTNVSGPQDDHPPTAVPLLSLIKPEFIASVRKKLALDQRAPAEIFGCGVNAFLRYEDGEIKPPLALVELLQVLERHSDLFAEIRTVYPSTQNLTARQMSDCASRTM